MREKKVFDGDLEGKVQANVRIKTRCFSVQESCGGMEVSIRILIQNFKAVVFEMNKLDFRGLSYLKRTLAICRLPKNPVPM